MKIYILCCLNNKNFCLKHPTKHLLNLKKKKKNYITLFKNATKKKKKKFIPLFKKAKKKKKKKATIS